jgi:hypothetical protein
MDASPVDAVPVVEETILFEASPVIEETVLDATSFDAVPVVEEFASVEDVSSVEEVAPFVSADAYETEIEITASDPIFLSSSSAVEEPAMDYIPVAEAQMDADIFIEAPVEETVVEMAAEDVSAGIPLQVFEVTEQAPVEQTLEKVMEQLNSPIVETLTVEELTHSSHPSIAPHQALSDIVAEAVSDGQIDESGEDTTE